MNFVASSLEKVLIVDCCFGCLLNIVEFGDVKVLVADEGDAFPHWSELVVIEFLELFFRLVYLRLYGAFELVQYLSISEFLLL